jgi:predicted PurR-regulated permease PerM
MQDTVRRTFVATLVVVAVVAATLALWELKLVIALVFLGFVIAAAMRPGVDALARRRIPRPAGVAMHYLGVAAVLGVLLWIAVPRAIDQVGEAIGSVPTSQQDLAQKAKHSTGIKHDFLVAVERRLKKLPSAGSLFHGAVTVGIKTFEVLIGVFFVLAIAAYWIFERERAMRLVLAGIPRRHRRVVRDTWDLIDLKLGAYVRGTLLLVLFVACVLSICFWLIGVPYWLLLGVFAGVVEIVPVIGPLAAGAAAIGVGLTSSWQVALGAGLAVLVVRLFEDYVVIPRVMGHAVGLSPLLVLVSVTAVGLLFGGFYVVLSTPLLAVLATLVDVILRDKDPANEDVPTVLFPAAKESEG